jgi:hypothetical protein
MLRKRGLAFAVAAAGAAVVLGAGSAVAASGWTVVTAPPTGANATLAGVATLSGGDAWAVGYSHGNGGTNVGAKALIDSWNGSAWSTASLPTTPGNTALLAAVSASSATDAWAVGHTQVNKGSFEPLGLHWNGSAWSVSSGLTSALGSGLGVGVADISSTDAYAIGYDNGSDDGQFAELAQWNGTAWSSVTLPQPANALSVALNAISANGPDDVWIVGTYEDEISSDFLPDEPYALHWNGTAWSVVAMPLVGSSNVNAYDDLDAVQVNSPTDVWAVGGSGVAGSVGGSTLIEHWNGTAWSIVSSPSPGSDGNLTGVTTSNASSSVWAVGYDIPAGASAPQTLTLNWNGSAWSTVTSPDVGSDDELYAVGTTPGAAAVWAVGSSGASGSFDPLALENG